MSGSDIRWQQRLQNFRKAFKRLSDANQISQERKLSELEQQGLIQSFEFTHELAWNVLKDYLDYQGIQGVIGSRGATREAFKNGLISDGIAWMEMIKSRNQTSHTYNEATANEITVAVVDCYFSQFENFLQRFTELEKSEP
jgi:nucleotidyltransferase substrate binding protein (TIGR01987 family)